MYKKSLILGFIGILLFTTVNAASIARETGEVELTSEQYRAVLDGKIDSLTVESTGDNRFSAIKVPINVIFNITVTRCNVLFKKFLEDNLPRLQSLANRNCLVYWIIWRCPYGGYRIFVVRPIRLCGWKEPIYKPKIPVWEWPQLEIQLDITNIQQ